MQTSEFFSKIRGKNNLKANAAYANTAKYAEVAALLLSSIQETFSALTPDVSTFPKFYVKNRFLNSCKVISELLMRRRR
jgi:glutaredoxin-related protein